MSMSTPTSKSRGYKVWHLAIAVPAIGLLLRVFLGALPPIPDTNQQIYPRYASAFEGHYDDLYFYEEPFHNGMPEMEILPLNLRGEMTGPLLASVLKRYYPESTTDQVNDLRDTLPPCDNPRMIVILPKDEEPVF